MKPALETIDELLVNWSFATPAFDPATGRLWETEHGPRGGDELNLIEKGKNYGWPVITHGIDYAGFPVGAGITAKDGMEQSVYYWDPVIAPSRLGFLRRGSLPAMEEQHLCRGARRHVAGSTDAVK
jgi:aldose sugar dehydrogenase